MVQRVSEHSNMEGVLQVSPDVPKNVYRLAASFLGMRIEEDYELLTETARGQLVEIQQWLAERGRGDRQSVRSLLTPDSSS